LDLALLNSLRPLARIVYLQLLLPHLLPCAMQQVNPHSSIAAKEISVSALQLPSVYLACVIQFQSVHH
jgi:hypothetical protein